MTNRTQTAVFLLVLAQGLVGCDGSNRSRLPPTGPSPVPEVLVAGTVSDAAWRPLAGATVEVVNGPHAGRSAITDGKGAFLLAGSFNETTEFRASMDGHVAAIKPLPPICDACRPPFWIFFELESVAPRADLAGDYTLTFIADSACADLPVEARKRTYEASVTPASGPGPANSRFNVTVSGARLLENYNSFTIGVAGDYMKSEIGDGHGAPGLVEDVGANTYITLGGEIAASVSATATISSSFNGAVERCELAAEWGSRNSCSAATGARAQCLSRNHQLILTRR